MRVLLINQYFPPDTSATAGMAAEVARALAAAGHRVTVLAGRPSYAPVERRLWRPLTREPWEECLVERVGSTAFDRRRMLGRVVNYLSYMALAVVRAPTHRTDLIMVMTDPPLVALVAALTASVRRVPFVYNVRDLHPDMALAAGLARPGLLAGFWERLHRLALRRARLVIVLGDDMRERVLAKGVPAQRVVVIRDGAHLNREAVAPSTQLRAAIRGEFRFVVMHAGNLGFAGAWDTLLAAARSLADEGVGMVFVGDGASRAGLKARAAGLANVVWLEPRPSHEVPAVLAAGDLQVVSVRRGLEGLVVPSKLYPVLAAGRAVLAVATARSDLAAIVAAQECGWVADPDDPVAVAAAIREALRDPAELARRAGRAAAAAGRFDRIRLLADLVQEIERLT